MTLRTIVVQRLRDRVPFWHGPQILNPHRLRDPLGNISGPCTELVVLIADRDQHVFVSPSGEIHQELRRAHAGSHERRRRVIGGALYPIEVMA